MKTPATPSMVAAIKAVHPSERIQAARLAEKAYAEALVNPNFEGSPELAGEYAAAEVAYHFS